MSSFCKCKSYSHFFSKNIRVHAIFNDQSFNDTLTKDIVSFDQLGPDCYHIYSKYSERRDWANSVDPDQMPQNNRYHWMQHLIKGYTVCYSSRNFKTHRQVPALMAPLDARRIDDQEVGGLPPLGRQHYFVEIDHEIYYYCHSLPSVDSRRAVVSFWRKNVHNTG